MENTLRKTTNCDNVAWIKDALERYRKAVLLAQGFPSISRLNELAKYAAVLEICELVCQPLDEDAKYNITPEEFRRPNSLKS